MLGSLKGYKGTDEFIALAKRMNKYSFELVINDSQENIDQYLKERDIAPTSNLAIYPRQEDVTPFYNRASLVVNLSNRNLFIETFGLTALEAMTAGLPVIVPTVGGIAEMVEDGKNGYRIDVQDIGKIAQCVEEIFTDKDLFITLAKNAQKCSAKFSERETLKMTEQVLTGLA
jgi:glycosyltransferase involved in cell wall biosynthesis